MLQSLSIRDVVLIERLDLSFGPGLSVLTGETGAGKSILLDSLGLALGMRADAGLVRTGAKEASVAASFDVEDGHPVQALLAEQGIEVEQDLVLRRVVAADGKSRAFVNGQPAGVALLRRIGALLVEVQGQHDQVGLADPATHMGLLDAFGVPAKLRDAVAATHKVWRAAVDALHSAEAAIEQAARDEEWLRHAVDELSKLAPAEGEEAELSTERQRMQQGERRAEAIAAAIAELTPRDRRSGPAQALRGAVRALQRLPAPNDEATPAMEALERAEEALAEADLLLARLASDVEADPRRLEHVEERLFALRAMARKHAVAVVELPPLLVSLKERLSALDAGTSHLAALHKAAHTARADYVAAASSLSDARRSAAAKLDKEVAKELPPLRLDKARFTTDVTALPDTSWGAHGADAVQFLVATNPGQAAGALAKVASGGELSRLMLALKVVLARGSPVPTLVFDEVDSGVGGATAAAVGERLVRVAERLQVLVVTHSPQVAARGVVHLQVAKSVMRGMTTTMVAPLDEAERREEIARMLAGETITAAARAAADSLLANAE